MRSGIPSTSPPSLSPAALTWTTHLTKYLGPRYSSQSCSPPPIPAPLPKHASGPHASMLTEQNQSIRTCFSTDLWASLVAQ